MSLLNFFLACSKVELELKPPLIPSILISYNFDYLPKSISSSNPKLKVLILSVWACGCIALLEHPLSLKSSTLVSFHSHTCLKFTHEFPTMHIYLHYFLRACNGCSCHQIASISSIAFPSFSCNKSLIYLVNLHYVHYHDIWSKCNHSI